MAVLLLSFLEFWSEQLRAWHDGYDNRRVSVWWGEHVAVPFRTPYIFMVEDPFQAGAGSMTAAALAAVGVLLLHRYTPICALCGWQQ